MKRQKIHVVHVYGPRAELHDYFVHATSDGALDRAARAVVDGIGGHPSQIEHVLKARTVEPGVGRTHVKCGAWHAHVDELELSK